MELKIIASAYACEPNKGSEPGIGWNIVRQLAKRHEMWVITRANNRSQIEQALAEHPAPNLHMHYFDLPPWARWWKQGTRGLQLYYYLWQIGAYLKARKLHQAQAFDLAHHITFGRYWNPSFLSLLPVPFVWGPIGGGESMPDPFWTDVHWKGQLYEKVRHMARWLGERDPFVRFTARHCKAALATTKETAARLKELGAEQVEVLGNAALSRREMQSLAAGPPPSAGPIRFISIGRLLHWKGFHLGLRALARSGLDEVTYWIVGDGPERQRLERIAAEAGLADRVAFWGNLPRDETLARLRQCHALIHPSLHDSGGWVCIEAMAAGRPVLCLNLGGPALMVTDDTGFKIDAHNAIQAVSGLARAMQTVVRRPSVYRSMSEKAQMRARNQFSWEAKAAKISNVYMDLTRPDVLRPKFNSMVKGEW